MTFSNPTALLLALLAIPVLALHAWRIRPRRCRVATGFLWERAASTSRARALWRRWRRPASLCLALALVGLLALAAADPHVPPPRTLVLVVDNSASMNATDVEPSRLAVAKRRAEELIAGLRYGDRLAIVSAGGPVKVLCGATGDQEVLRAAREAIPATKGPTRVDEAVRLGRRILAGSPNGRIVVLTDACFQRAAELAAADDVDLVPIGTRGDNFAVTRLEPRRTLTDPRRCQVLVGVTSFCDRPVRCRLALELDGKPLESVPVELAAAGRWQRVFELTTAEAGRIVARLDRHDDLADDNRAAGRFAPAATRRVILFTTGSLYLEKVLAATALVEVSMTDKAPAAELGRITVFDRQVPQTLPGGPVLVIDPAGPCDLWRLGDVLEEPEIARQDDRSPLLADVQLVGVRLGEARRLVLTGRAESIARPLAWTADGDPAAYAIDRPGGRVLVLLGNLETGELAQRTAFPILMGNALEWLAGGADRPAEAAEAQDAPGPKKGISPICAKHPPGRCAANWTYPLFQAGSSGCERLRPNFPPAESDLRVPKLQQPEAGPPPLGPESPPLWMVLAAAGVLLLVVEWGLYQRRWVC